MDEYTALAQRVTVGVGEVRGCLILSRDGLVLGAFPEEDAVKPAWLRFAALGDPQRGFLEFADQVWAYVHRGPYAAFATADLDVRPGLLIDHMEQALLSAEDARTRREPLKVPEAAPPHSGKPRSPLHPAADRPGAETASESPADDLDGEPADEAVEGGSPASDSALRREPLRLASDGGAAEDDPAEIDRVLLAKEFSGLLQQEDPGDEGTA